MDDDDEQGERYPQVASQAHVVEHASCHLVVAAQDPLGNTPDEIQSLNVHYNDQEMKGVGQLVLNSHLTFV